MRIYVVLAVVLATNLSFSGQSRITAQQPACLHAAGESPDQQLRKRQALTLARQINTAEAAAMSQTGSYQPLERLSRVGVAEGFIPHVAFDASGYAFSVKDSTDPCRFAFFSDQTGVIYQGEALR